ncbi:MAG: hypothetical protein Q9198_008794 [Flavoplaca austrocitrina]
MTEPYNPTKTPLTARETELIVMAMQCLEGNDIKIDYEKFAKMAEYGSRKSASTNLGGLLKHKITCSTVDNFSIASSASNASASPKKRTAPKTKNSATDTQDDGLIDNGAVKPSPKKRGPKKPAEGSPGKRAKKNSEAIVKMEEDGHKEEAAAKAANGEGIKQEGEGEFFEAANGSAREDLEI